MVSLVIYFVQRTDAIASGRNNITWIFRSCHSLLTAGKKIFARQVSLEYCKPVVWKSVKKGKQCLIQGWNVSWILRNYAEYYFKHFHFSCQSYLDKPPRPLNMATRKQSQHLTHKGKFLEFNIALSQLREAHLMWICNCLFQLHGACTITQRE